VQISGATAGCRVADEITAIGHLFIGADATENDVSIARDERGWIRGTLFDTLSHHATLS